MAGPVKAQAAPAIRGIRGLIACVGRRRGRLTGSLLLPGAASLGIRVKRRASRLNADHKRQKGMAAIVK